MRRQPLSAILFKANALTLCAILGLTLIGLGADFHHPADIVNHFRPLLFLGALFSCALAAAMRGNRGVRIAASLSFVLVVWHGSIIGPEIVRKSPTDTRPTDDISRSIVIASINAWSDRFDPLRLGSLIERERPDVIAFQELTPEALLRLPGVLQDSYPHRVMEGPVAMFSRHPMSVIAVYPLIYDSGRQIVSRPPLLVAEVRPGGMKAIRVIATHLAYPFDPESQAVQLAAFPQLVLPHLDPRTILVGDLNLTPWSVGLRRLDAALPLRRITRALPSWPAPVPVFGLVLPFPLMPIDHVFIGQDLRALSVDRGAAFGSDHYPIFARVALR